MNETIKFNQGVKSSAVRKLKTLRNDIDAAIESFEATEAAAEHGQFAPLLMTTTFKLTGAMTTAIYRLGKIPFSDD